MKVDSYKIEKGDYVLATKYEDGSPFDQWCIGFYDGITTSHYDPVRYNVVDDKGRQFRGNGFRRIKKISIERGKFILKLDDKWMSFTGYSVWHFARMKM